MFLKKASRQYSGKNECKTHKSKENGKNAQQVGILYYKTD